MREGFENETMWQNEYSKMDVDIQYSDSWVRKCKINENIIRMRNISINVYLYTRREIGILEREMNKDWVWYDTSHIEIWKQMNT